MNIALLGYGKMGKTIEKLAMAREHKIVYTASRENSQGALSQADVAIEFSSPEAAVQNITQCLERQIPVVSGTTGWLDRWDEVLKICEKRNGSFVYASNFSIGVNLFFNLNTYLAKLMQPWKEYEPTLEEIHHTQKKDAPSGTAITLAEGLLKYSDKKGWELDAEDSTKLCIKASRQGDVKGTHSIQYQSPIDTISIQHEAHSRDGFAMGALLAASWIMDKKEGVYSMKDVLNLT